eukprot:TRINITY_DN6845_c0_g2_i2.p1 TRINITY_DN6845_c0_g2~~TRINITY_DN6845_c0_g2_i2.p1  ORF type:complete len:449 (+),score=54.09 TRINITY_DN6845_c0_g2_i2:166-1512(+)
MDTDFEHDLEGFMSNVLEDSWDQFNSEVHEQLPIDLSNLSELQTTTHTDFLNEDQLINFIKQENQDLIFPGISFPTASSQNPIDQIHNTPHNTNANNFNNNNQYDEDWLQIIDFLEPAGCVQQLEQQANMSSPNNSSNVNVDSSCGEFRSRGEIYHQRSSSAPMVMVDGGCFRDMKYDSGNSYSPELQNTFPAHMFQFGQQYRDGVQDVLLNQQAQTHRRATSDVLPQFHYSQVHGFMDVQLDAGLFGCGGPMHSRSNTNCSDGCSQQTFLNHATISEEAAFIQQEHQLVPIMDAGVKEYPHAHTPTPYNAFKDQIVKTEVRESPTSVIFPPRQQQQHLQQQSMASRCQKSKRDLEEMSPRSRRRVVANRESAKKSRDRKERYKHDMEIENQILNKSLKTINKNIQISKANLGSLKQANLALREKILQLQRLAQIQELTIDQQVPKNE